MHLLILGLILVVGILVYYIMTTGSGKSGKSSREGKIKIKTSDSESHVPEDLRKEDNVIFLPTAGGSKPDDSAQADSDVLADSDVRADNDVLAEVTEVPADDAVQADYAVQADEADQPEDADRPGDDEDSDA